MLAITADRRNAAVRTEPNLRRVEAGEEGMVLAGVVAAESVFTVRSENEL
jgi:hypothetical protein